jgi:hypothetical protein
MSRQENISKVLGIVDKAVPDPSEKIDAAISIIESDNAQDDKWTKRARPAIIYTGLLVILQEMFGIRMLILSLLHEGEQFTESLAASNNILITFLGVFGAVASVYSWGRHKEKISHRQEMQRNRFNFRLKKKELKNQNK